MDLMLLVAQMDAGQWWRWGGPKREWQARGPWLLQPGSGSLAGQTNRVHLDSTFALWVVEEAGTAVLSRVSTAKTAWNRFVLKQCWLPALLWGSLSRLLLCGQQAVESLLPWSVRLMSFSLLNPGETWPALGRALSAISGRSPSGHSGVLPWAIISLCLCCSGLPSADDSPAKEYVLAGTDLGLTASVVGNALSALTGQTHINYFPPACSRRVRIPTSEEEEAMLCCQAPRWGGRKR